MLLIKMSDVTEQYVQINVLQILELTATRKTPVHHKEHACLYSDIYLEDCVENFAYAQLKTKTKKKIWLKKLDSLQSLTISRA
jgi:hypothetical protein